MADNKRKSPLVTKDDLNKGLEFTRSELRTEMQGMKTELRTEMQGMKTELRSEMQEIKTELKDDIKHLSIHMGKMEEKMATKDDTKRLESKIDGIYNLLDSIAGDVKKYQREDTLRGHAVIEHDEKLKDHETRLQKLETE